MGLNKIANEMTRFLRNAQSAMGTNAARQIAAKADIGDFTGKLGRYARYLVADPLNPRYRLLQPIRKALWDQYGDLKPWAKDFLDKKKGGPLEGTYDLADALNDYRKYLYRWDRFAYRPRWVPPKYRLPVGDDYYVDRSLEVPSYTSAVQSMTRQGGVGGVDAPNMRRAPDGVFGNVSRRMFDVENGPRDALLRYVGNTSTAYNDMKYRDIPEPYLAVPSQTVLYKGNRNGLTRLEPTGDMVEDNTPLWFTTNPDVALGYALDFSGDGSLFRLTVPGAYANALRRRTMPHTAYGATTQHELALLRDFYAARTLADQQRVLSSYPLPVDRIPPDARKYIRGWHDLRDVDMNVNGVSVKLLSKLNDAISKQLRRHADVVDSVYAASMGSSAASARGNYETVLSSRILQWLLKHGAKYDVIPINTVPGNFRLDRQFDANNYKEALSRAASPKTTKELRDVLWSYRNKLRNMFLGRAMKDKPQETLSPELYERLGDRADGIGVERAPYW